MTEPFAPSLQLPWSLVDVRSDAFDRVVVRLAAQERQPQRDPLGRHVSAVAAEPDITVEHATAEFGFTGVVLFRMCWESAEPELGDSTLEFRGDTFRWYLQSPLLQVQRDRSSENDAARLRHYQLICGELIDVICYNAPKVLFHGHKHATPKA